MRSSSNGWRQENASDESKDEEPLWLDKKKTICNHRLRSSKCIIVAKQSRGMASAPMAHSHWAKEPLEHLQDTTSTPFHLPHFAHEAL